MNAPSKPTVADNLKLNLELARLCSFQRTLADIVALPVTDPRSER